MPADTDQRFVPSQQATPAPPSNTVNRQAILRREDLVAEGRAATRGDLGVRKSSDDRGTASGSSKSWQRGSKLPDVFSLSSTGMPADGGALLDTMHR
mmetsp:Transcript_44024/g.99242  ORF Transcript_44024/g.99242 Transcript_44024/m.99242 type:complete len:97 (-) Transcript_44024:45-335(-)